MEVTSETVGLWGLKSSMVQVSICNTVGLIAAPPIEREKDSLANMTVEQQTHIFSCGIFWGQRGHSGPFQQF